MKTAEEHLLDLAKLINDSALVDDLKNCEPDGWKNMEDWVNSIKLDAAKWGMLKAAKIQDEDTNRGQYDTYVAIVGCANNLTTKDLQ